MGLLDALQLAENLGTLPSLAVLYGIEVGAAPSLAHELSSRLSQHVPQAAEFILKDIKTIIRPS